MKIDEILEKAEAERQREFKKIAYIRQDISCEKFKQLFMIRANQTLVNDHKCFEPFQVDDCNRDVLNLFYYYAARTNPEKINSLIGIVLAGAYGCGKSVMMSAFCKVLYDLEFIKEKVLEIHAIELAEEIRIKGVIPFARIPLLIQDMGKENNLLNNWGTKINPISNLLALRSEYGSLTFGSTNMNLDGIKDQYEEYISKRFDEHVNRIFLPGKSRRPDYSLNQPK
ncbi:MAG: hypothetical protein ACOYN4_05635 [Bacteroidales bacterium]